MLDFSVRLYPFTINYFSSSSQICVTCWFPGWCKAESVADKQAQRENLFHQLSLLLQTKCLLVQVGGSCIFNVPCGTEEYQAVQTFFPWFMSSRGSASLEGAYVANIRLIPYPKLSTYCSWRSKWELLSLDTGSGLCTRFRNSAFQIHMRIFSVGCEEESMTRQIRTGSAC